MARAQLTAEDWMDLALEELSRRGYGALKALSLANKLGVTRGSFYHHFETLEAFHTALIGHWARRTSGPVIDQAARIDAPYAALVGLLQTTLRSGEALERAVRSWATVSELVAVEVRKVDEARISVAAGLLERCGVARPTAAARAKLLYWAAIGRLMMPFPEESVLTPEEIADVAKLAATPD